MTCFWNGVLKSLNKNVFNYKLKNPTPSEIISILKKNNRKTPNVICNGEKFMNKTMEENMEWIKNLDINKIHCGHDCGTFNPFMVLICQLYKAHIDHEYTDNNNKKHTLTYRYTSDGKIIDKHLTTLNFQSSKTHFIAL